MTLAPVPHVFEGVEKRIEIRFELPDGVPDGLRTWERYLWDEICSRCKCTIIHAEPAGGFDSYILSESSLFVFSDRVMIKTCGTTVPLEGVDFLVTEAINRGFSPIDMTYSRSSFLFPDLQFYPHNDLASELDYLTKMEIGGRVVPGESSILGDASGKYWLVHRKSWTNQSSPLLAPSSSRVMVDVIMTGLCREACATYFKNQTVSEPENERVMSESLKSILPEFPNIVGKCYDPCGYSCNGIDATDNTGRYFTVHITPEAAFSYASVEAVFLPESGTDVESTDDDEQSISLMTISDTSSPTHLNHSVSQSTVADRPSRVLNQISKFVENVTSVFKPQDVIVTVLADDSLAAPICASQLPIAFGGGCQKASSEMCKKRIIYSQTASPYTSGNLLGEDIVASSVFYSAVSSGATGNKPPGLS